MNKIDTEKVIKTKNLLLEPILPSHAEKLFQSLQSSELYTFIPQEPPENILKLKEKYQKWSNRKSEDHQEIWLNYAIYNPAISEYVGTLQATIQKINTYIAYEVFPHFWRQGIATEACSALIRILFEDYKVDNISAHADTRNTASLKLLETLGLKKVDHILNADTFKGSTSHEFIYHLVK